MEWFGQATDATTPFGHAYLDQPTGGIRLSPKLPPRQRAAVVLRYWEGLTEAETAKAMNCSVGTVKSAASRGLSTLRELSAPTGRPRWARLRPVTRTLSTSAAAGSSAYAAAPVKVNRGGAGAAGASS